MTEKTRPSADIIPLPTKDTPATGTCPMCAKPTVAAYKPFCSKRCADLDLGQWLSEGYRVAGDEPAGFADEDDET